MYRFFQDEMVATFSRGSAVAKGHSRPGALKPKPGSQTNAHSVPSGIELQRFEDIGEDLSEDLVVSCVEMVEHDIPPVRSHDWMASSDLDVCFRPDADRGCGQSTSHRVLVLDEIVPRSMSDSQRFASNVFVAVQGRSSDPFPQLSARLPSRLHTATSLALGLLQRQEGDQSQVSGQRHIKIYTDGSAGSKQDAAWSAVILEMRDCGLTLLGNLRGKVGGPQSPYQNSMFRATNNEAELEAIFWAALFVVSMLSEINPDPTDFRSRATVELWSDSQNGLGHVGEETVSQNEATKPVARITAALWSCANMYSNASHGYVRGHSCNPWNELADRLAKETALGQLETRILQGDWSYLHDRGFLAGLTVPERMLSNIPKPVVQMVVPSYPLTQDKECIHTSKAQKKLELELDVWSFNVNTLLKVGKRRFLDGQFDEARADLIFFQEARSEGPHIQNWANYKYISVTSGCSRSKGNASHGGCEIWIKRKLGQYKVAEENLQVVHASSRRLLVILNIDGCKVLLASLHAPDHSKPDAEALEWWSETEDHYQKYKAKTSVQIVGIDANGRIGAEGGAGIGPVGGDAHDRGGDYLARFLETASLWVPCTYQSLAPFGTWRASSGHESRIDYICISDGIKRIGPSLVDREMDLMEDWQDHWPIKTRIGMTLTTEKPVSVHRESCVRKEQVEDPWVWQQIHDELNDSPEIGWDVDVHSHYNLVASRIKDTVQKWATMPSHIMKHDWYSKETCQLLETRRDWHKSYVWSTRKIARNKMLAIFHAWQGHSRKVEKFKAARSWHQMAATWSRYSRDWLLKPLRKSLRSDRRAAVEWKAEAISKAMEEHDTKKAYSIIKSMASFKPRIAPGVATRKYNTTTSEEERGAWLSFFASKQKGEATEWQTLLETTRMRQSENMAENACWNEWMPSVMEIRELMSALRFGKAASESRITNDILRLFAGPCSRMLTPLVQKSML